MPARFADDALATFIAELRRQPPPSAAAAGAIALRNGATERAAARPRGPELDLVRDLEIPGGGRQARLYRPTPAPAGLVLFLHGGGWVLGDLATHERACRRLAARSGVSVLALDYRRAPEHPWPAAVDDTVAALRWIASRPPILEPCPARVAVAGDSAGGTLATLACLRMRDERPGAMPAAQLLVYANTDLAGAGGSMDEKAHGFGLESDDARWFNAQWVPDPALQRDPRVSPLRAPDLSGLPRAVVITCEHDPLRDQGEAYAERLRQAGVAVKARREPGMVHNFLLWDLVSPSCAAAGERVADDLAELMRQG